MTQAKITETHERTIVRTFGRHELSSLLEGTVLSECAGHDGLKRKVEVRFEDETEGSPAYRVGTKATVTITIDLAEQPDDGQLRVGANGRPFAPAKRS